ncbi:MAG: sigma-70 family RNA polymerase sigma factor [Crocinitomicaceae bacterium]|nr:sigma-70 family RNA polymerase sigma factor [Crocinitomicaceae bacterium]
MKGVALRYASSEDAAEDILQESFIRVFKNLKAYKDKGSLGGWIRVITVNTSLELYRKDKTREKHYNEVQLDSSNEVSEDALRTIALEDLLKKIQALPTGYRLVFNLYAIEGFNHREIAKKLNYTEGTSKSQYARAKKLLQKMILEEEEFERKIMKDAR